MNSMVPLDTGEGRVGISIAIDDVEAAVEEVREEGMAVSLEAQEPPLATWA